MNLAEEQDPTPCWVHGDHRDGHYADNCVSPNHGCNQPGTGRLGLCPMHDRELLGDLP